MVLVPFVPTPDKWSANGSPIIQVREALTPFRGGLGVPSEGPFADQTSRFRTNGAQAGFMRVNRLCWLPFVQDLISEARHA